jgi:hypothetical protein
MSSKQQKAKINSPKQFIRAIHNYSKSEKKQAPSLRLGLGNARTITDCFSFGKIVEEIKSVPLYLKLIAPTQFPSALAEMKKGIPSIFMLESHEELMWSGAVLSIFKEKLCDFMNAKEDFECAFLNSSFEKALNILKKIEEDFGQSIWLLKSKISTLQLLYGLKDQKDYLEEIVNTEFFSIHAALVAYHTSIRSEENVTSSEVENELAEYPGDITFYFTYHLTPANLDRITDPSVVLCVEETQTIIDRLLAHIAMLQLYFASANFKKQHLDEIIRLSAWIPDKSIENITTVSGAQPARINDNELYMYEQYALGNYRNAPKLSGHMIELLSYERAHRSQCLDSENPSLYQEVISLMAKTVTYATGQVKIKNRLGKIAMISPSLALSTSISNFLENSNQTPAIDTCTRKSSLALINGSISNPNIWRLLAKNQLVHEFSVFLTPEQNDFNSVRLFRFMEEDLEEGTKHISELALPDYRLHTYIGHLAFKHGQYEVSEENYKLALASKTAYPQDRVRSYLFDSVFAQGKIEYAVQLAVEHCLRNRNVVELYPLEELSKAALGASALRSEITTAILVHLTARHVHMKWERKLSDIHENVLYKARVEKPSQLLDRSASFEPQMLTYFLRHVCVSRILDDSSAYSSVEEIEEERIAICQWLITLDPEHKNSYATEIKDITRNENIASMWQKFQSGKVYVDEDGLRNFLAPSFKETFRRYVVLRDSPSLNTQAEKLAKALERILKDGNSGFKNIKLPASEAESLFDTMIYQFVSTFATHPAYGLDTHLSTAIRHGVFEGHIRTALINMLCIKIEDRYLLPEGFRLKISHYVETMEKVNSAFIRFTKKIESLISLYLSDYFRIYSDQHTSGLFSFVLPDEVRADAMARMHNISEYEEFMNEFFSVAWQLTDISTQAIKENIENSLKKQIYQAFDLVLQTLRPAIPDTAFSIVEQEVVDARLRIQRTLDDMSSWFNRPLKSYPDEIDLEMIVEVALKQIANCYTDDKLIPSVNYSADRRLKGSVMTGLVETLFILLQNIIIHGGVERDLKGVVLAFNLVSNSLTITVENPIGPAVDALQLTNSIAEALERYRTGSGLTKASTEGGSGLSKIWRIMEFEIKKLHSLELELHNGVFKAKLRIENLD